MWKKLAESGMNVPVSPPERKKVEQFVTGMEGIRDNIACSMQTSPMGRIKIFNGWGSWAPMTLGGFHYPSQDIMGLPYHKVIVIQDTQ